jgi:hypothetical protein
MVRARLVFGSSSGAALASVSIGTHDVIALPQHSSWCLKIPKHKGSRRILNGRKYGNSFLEA